MFTDPAQTLKMLPITHIVFIIKKSNLFHGFRCHIFCNFVSPAMIADTAEKVDISFDGIADPKRLGIVFLSTDITGPEECQRILSEFPSLVSVSTNCRFREGDNSYSVDNYQYAADNLPYSMELLRPYGTFDVGIHITKKIY